MSEQTGTSARIAGQREPADGGTPPVIDAAFARWLADRAGQALLRSARIWGTRTARR